MFSVFDQHMMLRAIKLAKRGRYTTAPNPNVGCVITQAENVVGEGYHYQADQPAAEFYALQQAQLQAKGATVYITLEPTMHKSHRLLKTDVSSVDAFIAAGVARIVCAMKMPDPQLSGCGIARLKAAGIQVDVGLLHADAAALNPSFIKQAQCGMPYVELKLAASLDGRTALANGESKWITGPKARADVQRHRAQAGAILSTSATVIADDPSLNVRWNELGESVQDIYPQSNLRQPIRVIIDSQNRLTPHYQLFHLPGETILARTTIGDEIWPDSVQQWLIPTQKNSERVDLQQLFLQLAQYGVNHIWVEAGASLAGALLEHQLVDSLILYQAPKLMGSDSRGLINLSGLTAMTQTPMLTITDVRMVDCDVKITATVQQNNLLK